MVVQSIGQWSAENRPRDNREEGRIPSPAPSGYSRDKQHKSATASSEISQKFNIRSRNNDKPRTPSDNVQRPATGRHQQQPTMPHTGQTK